MILHGDCLATLKTLEANSVDCVVTSPPYWGLRDYGVPGQLGLEATPEEYVARMVEVFREVRRVLKPEGTLWLNLGDSYAGSTSGNTKTGLQALANKLTGGNRELMPPSKQESLFRSGEERHVRPDAVKAGLKPKDLVGIPWRVAFALQADGWYLRQDIIWHKPNPMPESVRDRCTKAHEYIFLLSSSPKYFFDADAVKEPCVSDHPAGNKVRMGSRGRAGKEGWALDDSRSIPAEGRNKRSVWTVTPKPFKGAHFATFPPDLIEPCILAGCPEGGIVLDPFFGAGTTGLVAQRHGRKWIGIELNAEYVAIATRRIEAAG